MAPLIGGLDSSVGIATCYGLDGPGIESRWGRDFTHTSGPAVVSTQPHVQWIPCHSLGVKRPKRGAHHPPQSKCRGHEKVGLYLYSTSGPQWPVVGRTLLLYASYRDYTKIMVIFFNIKFHSLCSM